jgi:hypothetical protein
MDIIVNRLATMARNLGNCASRHGATVASTQIDDPFRADPPRDDVETIEVRLASFVLGGASLRVAVYGDRWTSFW